MSVAQKNPVMSLERQAAVQEKEVPPRGQASLLTRHFLERFLNNESVTSSGDAKARLVQVACMAGFPGAIVAMYLWPVYHRMFGGAPTYWENVSHHFFFVIYAIVTMGIIMVYEWDLFFPDLLDIFVLSTLPVTQPKLFAARTASIAILVTGFLFDANILAPFALAAASDPPDFVRFLMAHLLAVAAGGIFAAAFIVGLQAVLLGVLGEAFFRRVAPFLQATAITALLMLLFLFPVITGVMPNLLRGGHAYALYFPPFWFLGIYQRVMEGADALPIYAKLAQMGSFATLYAAAAAVIFYPIAYLRRTHGLIVGLRATRRYLQRAALLEKALHATMLRSPVRRAVFHFISQTLLRLQRYRMCLVLCGGVAASLAVAALLRLVVHQGHLQAEISPDGRYIAIPILVFWTIAALRMAFLAPGNEQGSWIFRTILGKPTLDALHGTKQWVLLWALAVTGIGSALLYLVSPQNAGGLKAAVIHAAILAGLGLLLTDIFFLNVKTIPFTRAEEVEKTNIAITVMKYIAFFPAFVFLPAVLFSWAEMGFVHLILVFASIAVAHYGLDRAHRNVVCEHLELLDLDGESDGSILTLGLRR